MLSDAVAEDISAAFFNLLLWPTELHDVVVVALFSTDAFSFACEYE
jgi:hypothetical protein